MLRQEAEYPCISELPLEPALVSPCLSVLLGPPWPALLLPAALWPEPGESSPPILAMSSLDGPELPEGWLLGQREGARAGLCRRCPAGRRACRWRPRSCRPRSRRSSAVTGPASTLADMPAQVFTCITVFWFVLYETLYTFRLILDLYRESMASAELCLPKKLYNVCNCVTISSPWMEPQGY